MSKNTIVLKSDIETDGVRSKTAPKLKKAQWVELIARKLLDEFNEFCADIKNQVEDINEKQEELERELFSKIVKSLPKSLTVDMDVAKDHGSINGGTYHLNLSVRSKRTSSIASLQGLQDSITCESSPLYGETMSRGRYGCTTVSGYSIVNGHIDAEGLIRAARKIARSMYEEENDGTPQMEELYNNPEMQKFLARIIAPKEQLSLEATNVEVV